MVGNCIESARICSRSLHAAHTVYHQTCSINFRTGKQVPRQHSGDSGNNKGAKRLKQGRPVDTTKNLGFMKVMQYLVENDEEQMTRNKDDGRVS